MDNLHLDDASKVRRASIILSFFLLTSLPNLQKELEQFIQREQAGARARVAVQQYTSICWDKCVPSPFACYSGD
jgi:hypothetical protein